MKKIPTLYKREFDTNGNKVSISNGFTNDICKQALAEGTPTIKFDGSCCAIINGKFYKRYDAKKGKPIPIGAIKCQEKADEVTGHLPCWVRVREDNPSDKWLINALDNALKIEDELLDGTYEAVGKHFNANPYNLFYDTLIKHGESKILDLERTFEGVKDYLEKHEIEGIVFWLNDEPVCKVKRSDFGFKWKSS
jgi:hypothetical protein